MILKSIKYILIFSFLITIASCVGEKRNNSAQSESEADQPLIPEFSQVSVTKEYGNCRGTNEKCLSATIQYPKVENGFDILDEEIQHYVYDYVADFVVTEKPIGRENLKQFIEESLTEKEQQILSSTEEYGPIFQLEINIKPEYKNSSITTLSTSFTSFEGGAHPNSGAGYLVYENESGELLNDQIILQDAAFKEMLLAKLKNQYDIQGDLMESGGFLVNDADFAVSDNIGVDKDKLYLTYSPYEIAPYSMGFINFEFQRDEVVEYLNPEFVNKWNN